jgi:hypothetical protein
MLVATCLAVLGAVVMSGATAAQLGDPFRGRWTSTDFDGSHQMLDIRGAGRTGHYALSLFDDSATTACEGSPAHLRGSGVVDGDSLVMTGTLVCRPGGNPLRFRTSLAFTYDPGTDTLTDESGVAWDRA